ncbi:DUF7660 family protein, partial [Nocardia cyriacigeorgica]|uniref:DUF7660 family protein n=1 Tax=Nocardia cyriacigeorgica TaxID=135487 RepID=UPI003D80C1B2
MFRDQAFVDSRESFIRFAHGVARDIERNPEAYQNVKTADLLEAAASWLEDAHNL